MVQNKETENKIAQLQMLEQNIQNISLQKQNFQSQVIEMDTALSEIEGAKGQVYKIIGAVMVASDKKNLKKELEDKKEVFSLRIKAVEKQENQLKEKAETLQKEVLEQLKENQ